MNEVLASIYSHPNYVKLSIEKRNQLMSYVYRVLEPSEKDVGSNSSGVEENSGSSPITTDEESLIPNHIEGDSNNKDRDCMLTSYGDSEDKNELVASMVEGGPVMALLAEQKTRNLKAGVGKSHHGELHVLPGPMYSEKTEDFISLMLKYAVKGLKCIILRFQKDDRYTTEDEIVTHGGQRLGNNTHLQISIKSFPTDVLLDFVKCAPRRDGGDGELTENGLDIVGLLDKYDVVGIDEAQFAEGPDNILARVAEILVDNWNRHLVIAGINLWHTGKPVSTMAYVVLYATRVNHAKRAAECYECKRKRAHRTVRLNEYNRGFLPGQQQQSAQLVEVGGAGMYVSVCRMCIKKKKQEALIHLASTTGASSPSRQPRSISTSATNRGTLIPERKQASTNN